MNKWIIGVCILIILDWITGFYKAFRNHNIQSSKMRTGLENKIKEIVVMLIGIAIDNMQSSGYMYLPIQFLPIVSAYICFMEIASIFENIGFALPKEITKYFEWQSEEKLSTGSEKSVDNSKKGDDINA